jgi:hypothetical protein
MTIQQTLARTSLRPDKRVSLLLAGTTEGAVPDGGLARFIRKLLVLLFKPETRHLNRKYHTPTVREVGHLLRKHLIIPASRKSDDLPQCLGFPVRTSSKQFALARWVVS